MGACTCTALPHHERDSGHVKAFSLSFGSFSACIFIVLYLIICLEHQGVAADGQRHQLTEVIYMARLLHVLTVVHTARVNR